MYPVPQQTPPPTYDVMPPVMSPAIPPAMPPAIPPAGPNAQIQAQKTEKDTTVKAQMLINTADLENGPNDDPDLNVYSNIKEIKG